MEFEIKRFEEERAKRRSWFTQLVVLVDLKIFLYSALETIR